ncbi:hypothetical protein WBK31_03890 [Nonomuraea sp. N2-4H]|uniref:hypothetical protein n=1 Tax=Nonomuraea sp. N2-4H TaxID=3128898 RepID=UPI00324E96A5
MPAVLVALVPEPAVLVPLAPEPAVLVALASVPAVFMAVVSVITASPRSVSCPSVSALSVLVPLMSRRSASSPSASVLSDSALRVSVLLGYRAAGLKVSGSEVSAAGPSWTVFAVAAVLSSELSRAEGVKPHVPVTSVVGVEARVMGERGAGTNADGELEVMGVREAGRGERFVVMAP